MESISHVELTFKLPYQTNFGENLYVVGSLPPFGAWDPRKGRRMVYKQPATWYLHLDLRLETDKPIELKYKYVVMNDNEENGGIPRWEPGQEHILEINNIEKLECSDVWGVGKKVRQIPVPDPPGKLFYSPLPFSRSFDPFQSVYRELSSENIDVIVCLCYHTEIIQQTGGHDLIKKYGKDGFAVIWYPVEDFSIPQDKISFAQMISHVFSLLKKGCNVAVHCHAGIGRTGLTVACLAKKHFKKDVGEVITWIRESIIGALQTKEQVDYVLNFS